MRVSKTPSSSKQLMDHMYVYICSSLNLNDIPRWQKVMMMTSGRISKKKFLCIRFTFWCSVKSTRFLFFATERFFKCPLKLFSQTIENSQWLHFCVFPQSDFSNVFSNHSPEQMKSHIGCICFVFVQSDASNGARGYNSSHIGCIDTIFLAGTGVAPTLHPFMDVIIPR